MNSNIETYIECDGKIIYLTGKNIVIRHGNVKQFFSIENFLYQFFNIEKLEDDRVKVEIY